MLGGMGALALASGAASCVASATLVTEENPIGPAPRKTRGPTIVEPIGKDT